MLLDIHPARVETILHSLVTLLFCLALVRAQPLRISTGDGLTIEMNHSGAVTGLRVVNRTIPLTQPGGFFLADFKKQPESPNLVPNPGFEEGGKGWNLDKTQSIDDTLAHTGRFSVRLHIPGPEKGTSNVGIRVPVEPFKRYRVSLWVRRQNCGVCGAYISQLDEAGKYATEPLQVGMPIPQIDNQWLQVTRDIETSPKTRQLLVRADIYRSTGTIWLDDFSVRLLGPKQFYPVRGTLRQKQKGVYQFDGGVGELQIKLAALFTCQAGNLRVDAELEDESGEDRAVAVAFRLPFDASGWTWHDDTVDKRTISEPMLYENVYQCESGEGRCSIYPLGVLSGKKEGLTIALPLSQGPRVFLVGYDEENKWAYLNFYFGLTSRARKWPSRAAFSFVLFHHDPDWGFRSALQRYYDFFPESFRKRLPFEGYLNYANLERFDLKTHKLHVSGTVTGAYEDASDFGDGFRFLWHLHGCYDFRMVPTEQREMLSDETVWELLRKMVEEEKRQPRYYCPTEETIKKIVLDHNGRIRYIADTQYWEPHQGYNHTDKPGWGLNFRVNEDPEVSPVLAQKTREVLEEFAKEGTHRPFEACLTADAIEGYFGNTHGLDYRPEHIAVTDLPLTFGERTLIPAIPNTIWDLHQTVWYPLSEKFQVATYGNANGYEQVFILPFVDVPMIEWDWDPARPGRFERFCRIVARHKIWRFWRTCGKGEDDPESVELHFRRGLAYAIYPAVYPLKTPETYRAHFRQFVPAINALSTAGWEPVTWAQTDNADVVVERYGSFSNDNLHFTLRNYAAHPATVVLSLDFAGLGIPLKAAKALLARDLLSGEVTQFANVLKVNVEGNGAKAVWVGTPQGAARHALKQCAQNLNRLERLFATELSDEDRALIARGLNLTKEGVTGANPLLAASELHYLLEQLGHSIKTVAPVDLTKVLFRARTELSAGVAALIGLNIQTPRLQKCVPGGTLSFDGLLHYSGTVRLTDVTARVLSPWEALTMSSTIEGFPASLNSGAEEKFKVTLSIPPKLERRLLPFLISVGGKVGNRTWYVEVPVDVEIVPPLSMSAIVSRLYPSVERNIKVRINNAADTPATGTFKLGSIEKLTFRPAELPFSIAARSSTSLDVHISVAPDARPGEVRVPVSISSDDERFALKDTLTLRVTGAVPVGEIRFCPTPPRIDGELSDAAWSGKPLVPEFISLTTGKPVSEKTSVWMTYDQEGIYIAFRCAESNMPGIVAQFTTRGSPLYKDDDVEIFVLPPGQPAAFQFAVNALGTMSDNFGDTAPWKAAAKQNNDAWSVEVFIPFTVFHLDRAPDKGESWGFQFGRQQKQKGETSAWTLCPYFNAPDLFGEVVFR